MKKLCLALLPLLYTIPIQAQEEELDVKIRAPRMTQLIDKLWVDLPTNCIVPASATIDQGDETCAGVAMKHFRHVINSCTMSDGFKEAIKTEFKIIKLIPVGKAVGVMLDVADLTAKALTAESPEALEADLVKYGFGKVVGDQVVGKLKKFLPDDVGTDVLTNLTKLYYKQLWDKAKEAILPSEQSYQCQPETEACKDNIHISIEPYAGDDAKILGRVVFSASGDCQCKLSCSPGTPRPLLKTWSVHGDMPLIIEKAEVVDERSFLIFTKKILQVTLVAGRPSYHVQADCECNETSDGSNISYDEEPVTRTPGGGDLFVGLGLVNEDAGDRFNLYGINAAYTHPLSSSWGATGDAGLYFGKQQDMRYTRIQVLAGISKLPGDPNKKVLFMPHLLAGIANTRSKSSDGNFSSSSSGSAFSAVLGTDIITDLKCGKRIGLRVGYNPAFPQGGAVHNLRLSVGMYF